MSISKLQMDLNNIAVFCFRDIADYDYISARTLFRNELLPQAYWCALQSIEKYLKAILLFNGKDTLHLSHDLIKSLDRIKRIKEIKFSIPEDVITFLTELNNEGNNRYYEYPYGFQKLSLFKLDKSVWHIRKYCFYLKGSVKLQKRTVDLLQFNLIQIGHEKYEKNPHKYTINRGVLESILDKSVSIQREQLVWNNSYYGAKRKKSFLKHDASIYGNPPHFFEKEIFSKVKDYIQFSQPVKDYFNKSGITSASTATASSKRSN